MYLQRRYNVTTLQRRCNDVVTTLLQRCVFAGVYTNCRWINICCVCMGVVGLGEDVLSLLSPGCSTDICLKLGKFLQQVRLEGECYFFCSSTFSFPSFFTTPLFHFLYYLFYFFLAHLLHSDKVSFCGHIFLVLRRF